MASLVLLLGLLVALPVTPLVGKPQSANAAVTSGSVVYTNRNSSGTFLMLRSPTGVVTQLANADANGTSVASPAVSPDGSQIAFTMTACHVLGSSDACFTTAGESTVIVVVNSDGSDLHAVTHGDASNSVTDWFPTWSSDGGWVAFDRVSGVSTGVYKVHADGSGLTQMISDSDPNSRYQGLTWSPNGSKFAFARLNTTTTKMELFYSNTDGSGATKIPNQPYLTGGTDNSEVTWAPNSTRVYFQAMTGGNATIDGINIAGTSLVVETNANPYYQSPSVSADGNTLVVTRTFGQLFTVPASGTKVETDITSDAGDIIHEWPAYVRASYPPAPPSNATVAVQSPTPHDAPYTRQISIKLSNSGVSKWQYGWSTSATTAPTVLQESTFVATKVGTLNYLGKLSGSTYSGGTQPDANWYLWVRAYKTVGGAQAWGTPLLVHTPKTPVWVGIGDSYSSGHHQDNDERLCPSVADAPYYDIFEPSCVTEGAPHVMPNDVLYSWTNGAANILNANLHVPTAWQLSPLDVAISGASTASFGLAGQTPGTNAWASGGTQTDQMRSVLYLHPGSWSIVSISGGADDSNWVDILKAWYKANFFALYAPWNITDTNLCPDSQAVYADLTGGSPSVNTTIQTNLQGVQTVAVLSDVGVRILAVGYPQVLDASNVCQPDRSGGTIHGFGSVVGQLNTDMQAVNGANAKYLDLTSVLGTTPVTSGYIQLTRLYGYPHPVTAGQSAIATAAANKITGSGW